MVSKTWYNAWFNGWVVVVANLSQRCVIVVSVQAGILLKQSICRIMITLEEV